VQAVADRAEAVGDERGVCPGGDHPAVGQLTPNVARATQTTASTETVRSVAVWRAATNRVTRSTASVISTRIAITSRQAPITTRTRRGVPIESCTTPVASPSRIQSRTRLKCRARIAVKPRSTILRIVSKPSTTPSTAARIKRGRRGSATSTATPMRASSGIRTNEAACRAP
jgi:hypothetical protein